MEKKRNIMWKFVIFPFSLSKFKVRWRIVPETETGGAFVGISQHASAAGLHINCCIRDSKMRATVGFISITQGDDSVI